MTRGFGLPREVSAQAQAQKLQSGEGIQPLPSGSPRSVLPISLGIKDAPTIKFLMFGDCGGVANPTPQGLVAAAMESVLDDVKPAFALIVGDLVYYNGDPAQWGPQFYEPYATALSGVPIIGFPGNHDGDGSDGVPGSGIASFMANLCTRDPMNPPSDPQLEHGRSTQTLPYCDWVLAAQSFTMIALWSNVPSGGHLFPSQQEFLTLQLKAARNGVPVIVGLHHPPYSVDAHHGGSLKMGKELDAAFTSAGRFPEMVVSGHVHDYQRFARVIQDPPGADGPGTGKYEQATTYIVSGNGGYHNLHKLAADAVADLQVTPDTKFSHGDDKNYGFCIITAGDGKLTGEYVAVDKHSGTVVRNADTF